MPARREKGDIRTPTEEGGKQFLLRLDDDTAESLKTIPPGGKAAFVNAAIRQTFRDRAVLDAVAQLREDLRSMMPAGGASGPSPEAFAEEVMSRLPTWPTGGSEDPGGLKDLMVELTHAVSELHEEVADVRNMISTVQDQAGVALARLADAPRLSRQVEDLHHLADRGVAPAEAPGPVPVSPAEDGLSEMPHVLPARRPLRLPGLG